MQEDRDAEIDKRVIEEKEISSKGGGLEEGRKVNGKKWKIEN